MSDGPSTNTNKWLVTFAGMSGSVSMVLSSTIANVAVPTVMGAFGIGQDQAQWLATAFIATMVASQLVSAWFAKALGVRRAFFVIYCVFFIGTAIAYTAQSIEMLIVGRVLQGFSAGVIQPMVMALIFSLFPPERRGQAMGIHGMGIQLAPMLGPTFGGLVIDSFGWREIFLVPVPICILSLLLSSIFLPGRQDDEPPPRFDWAGYTLLITALVFLLAAGANGQRYGWGSDKLMVMAVVGLSAGIGFVWLQLRSESPLLDMSLFRIPQFTAAATVAFVFGLGNFASNYLIPVYVQQVQGFTPSLAGLLLIPAGLIVICGTPVFGRVADVFPAHLMVMLGLCLFAFGNFLMSQTDVHTTFFGFAVLIVIARSGMALIMPSLSTSALRALTAEQLNRGSGTINFIRQLGGACGITSLVVFMEQRTQFHAEALVATQTSANSVSMELLARVSALLAEAGISEQQRDSASLHYLNQVVEAQALTLGFCDGFAIIAVVFVLAVIPAWNLGKARRRAT